MPLQPLKQRKILITGAAGFLGVHVAQALAAAGARLLLQDTAHKRADLLAPVLKSGRADFVICDLGALEAAPALLAELPDVDYVVHLGLREPDGSAPGLVLDDYLAANLAPFEDLLGRLPRAVKGVCLASSLSVYGQAVSEPVDETYPTQPQTPYAQAKRALEQALSQHGQRIGTPVSVLRFSTLYGPGEENAPRAVPSIIRNLLAGQSPVIYGDGGDVYDYLYVADAAHGVRLALEHMGKAPGVYNVGSGHGWTTRAITETIQRLVKQALPPMHMPARGPRHTLVADITRASARLGFQPATPLEVGLMAAVDDCRAQAGARRELAAEDSAHGLLARTSPQPAGL